MHEIVKLDDNVERTYKLFRFQNLSPEEAVNLTALSVNLKGMSSCGQVESGTRFGWIMIWLILILISLAMPSLR
jgi:hypothetical protein